MLELLHSHLIKTSNVRIASTTPRDRCRHFEPQIVKKREIILAESLEKKIIGMYGLEMSLRDISSHIKDIYDTEISTSTLFSITDKVIPLVKESKDRSRPTIAPRRDPPADTLRFTLPCLTIFKYRYHSFIGRHGLSFQFLSKLPFSIT